jgi:hypothetical protein
MDAQAIQQPLDQLVTVILSPFWSYFGKRYLPGVTPKNMVFICEHQRIFLSGRSVQQDQAEQPYVLDLDHGCTDKLPLP